MNTTFTLLSEPRSGGFQTMSLCLTALDDGHHAIELHSQSRLGQGDLGVNPDRLEGLHAALVA